MKTKSKGHEFDEMYKNILHKKKFYLFGAGDYGNQFIKIMQDEINICGYIDNDKEKNGKFINGIPCCILNEAEKDPSIGIIVTMSQIARKAPIVQLNNENYKENIDYFIIEEFLSVYYVYKYNKVYFSSISFLPSTICNLKCKHCLNFNPYAEKFYVREWEDLVRDVDLFFSCVDRIMLFHISGGEPMLYKHTAELIKYISDNYGERIDTLRTVTNGTVVPNKEMLETLSKCNVEVTVDDYRAAVPQYNENFEQLISGLKKYNIRHYINSVDTWIDLAPERTDLSEYTEEDMQNHFNNCCQSWQELRDGKLYTCNYAAYAAVAGLCNDSKEEKYDLQKFSPNKRKELIEFRLGYTEKGYTNFCRHCLGFSDKNTNIVLPAVQV